MALDHVLKGCELFFELYEDEVTRILRSQEVHQYKPGEIIIKQGSQGDSIYVLLEGIAQVQKSLDNGVKIDIEKLKPGEVFGLLMVLDDRPYGVDITARTRCAALEIKHSAVMDLFEKNPRIFGIIMLNICRLLGKRLRNTYAGIAASKAR